MGQKPFLNLFIENLILFRSSCEGLVFRVQVCKKNHTMKKLLSLLALATIATSIWFVKQPITSNPSTPEMVKTEITETTMHESRSEIERRLAAIGWSLKNGTTITTTSAAPEPASKN